jgi:hypothetical protein
LFVDNEEIFWMSLMEYHPGSINIERVPPPWDSAIPPLLASVIQAPFRDVPPNIHRMLEANIYEIQVSLHWLIRLEWNSRYKIPVKRSLAKVVEPTGRWLQTILHLCEKVFTICGLGGISMRYTRVEQLFYEIIQNLFFVGKQMVLANLYPVQSVDIAMVGKSNHKKRSELQILHHSCSLMKAREIPPNRNLAFFDLVATSAQIAESPSMDRFRIEYYQPFVSATRAMLDSMDSPGYKSFFEQDGELYEQLGKGKHSKKVKP